jgi:hypothetical protein
MSEDGFFREKAELLSLVVSVDVGMYMNSCATNQACRVIL